MPRPKLNRTSFNATLPGPLLASMDAYAEAIGKTRSDVIEDASREYLSMPTRKRFLDRKTNPEPAKRK